MNTTACVTGTINNGITWMSFWLRYHPGRNAPSLKIDTWRPVLGRLEPPDACDKAHLVWFRAWFTMRDTQRLTVATSTQPNCACHDDTSLSLCGNACDCQSHLFVHTTPPYIHHIECWDQLVYKHGIFRVILSHDCHRDLIDFVFYNHSLNIPAAISEATRVSLDQCALSLFTQWG